MIKVMLVDDHLLLKEGLRKLFETEGDIEVVADASTGEEAIRLVREIDVDLILMDISMPGLGGIKAIKKIKEIKPGVKIIVLTMHDDEACKMEALRAGASEYLIKDIGACELLRAIRSVCGFYKEEDLPIFTPREKEVLSLIIKGKKNKEIAKELGLKEKTVRNYVSNILQKLGVKDRTQAVIMVLREGLKVGEDKGGSSR
ncbi:MAG: response regulator transcription factor [Synergistetes bacterium]|nr:response regulator transcription factor [Synergistota bacterium]MDW8192989.1 response regulator transcription factor [Synergistota bacterium]